MDNLLNDTGELKQSSAVLKMYIERLLMFPWLITGDEKERQLIKEYAKPHQQERYAYLLMQRLLQ